MDASLRWHDDGPAARVHPASPSRATVRNSSGATRMAAPVGQARTQAGPPSMPEHMSHLTARFGVSGETRLSIHFFDGSPGPGPRPASSQASKGGFFGGTFSIRITP